MTSITPKLAFICLTQRTLSSFSNRSAFSIRGPELIGLYMYGNEGRIHVIYREYAEDIDIFSS